MGHHPAFLPPTLAVFFSLFLFLEREIGRRGTSPTSLFSPRPHSFRTFNPQRIPATSFRSWRRLFFILDATEQAKKRNALRPYFSQFQKKGPLFLFLNAHFHLSLSLCSTLTFFISSPLGLVSRLSGTQDFCRKTQDTTLGGSVPSAGSFSWQKWTPFRLSLGSCFDTVQDGKNTITTVFCCGRQWSS